MEHMKSINRFFEDFLLIVLKGVSKMHKKRRNRRCTLASQPSNAIEIIFIFERRRSTFDSGIWAFYIQRPAKECLRQNPKMFVDNAY